METLRLKEVFPQWKTGAIFTALSSRGVPWANVFAGLTIDFDYYGNFSGNKIISGLVENILPSDGVLTSVEITILCDVIMGLYSLKWGKLWETMNFEYNPIENYNMVEEMTDDETVREYGKTSTRTDNLTHQRTDNLTSERIDNLSHQRTDNLASERTDNLSHQRTDNLTSQRTDNLTSQRTDNLTHGKTGTETETPNTTTQDNNGVYGFNSVTAVPSDSRTIQNIGTNQTAYNTQEVDTGTQTQTNTGTQSQTNTGTQTDLNTGTQRQTNTGTQTDLNTGNQIQTNTGTQTDLNTGNQIQTNTGTQTDLNTGTQRQANTGTQTDTESGTQAFADGGCDTQTRNYTLTRSGNIGVTTSQQMIEAERELWRMWNFFRGIVYPDIDRVLTIEIY